MTRRGAMAKSGVGGRLRASSRHTDLPHGRARAPLIGAVARSRADSAGDAKSHAHVSDLFSGRVIGVKDSGA